MEQQSVKINLTSYQIKVLLTTIIILNFCMMIGTYGFAFYLREVLGGNWEEGSRIKHVLVQFNLAVENVFATWYSSILLLLVAIISMICFLVDKQTIQISKSRYLSYGWLIFSIVFIILSLDEVGSLHENLGAISALNPVGDYALGWVLLLGIPIGIVGLFMLAFGWMHVRSNTWAFVFMAIGVFLFFTVPFQEKVEEIMWRSVQDRTSWERPILFILLEEGTELFGTLCFIIATTTYAFAPTQHSKKFFSSFSQNVSISLNATQFRKAVLFFSITMGLMMLIISFTLEDVEGGDRGIAKNWFPSAMAFNIFLITYYICVALAKLQMPMWNTYLFLALFTLLRSMWYGSGLYGYFIYSPRDKIDIIVITFLVAIISFFGIYLFKNSSDLWARLEILIWILLNIVALSIGNEYFAELSYLAATILLSHLITQLFHYQYKKYVPN